MPTDTQLKLAFAEMLSEKVELDEKFNRLHYKQEIGDGVVWPEIRDTELLHLCWLVEEELPSHELGTYMQLLDEDGDWQITHATWQQRTIALCKVKGIEVV